MNTVRFKVNGRNCAVSGGDVASDTTLQEYLRYTLGMLGTKSMCLEGGCGACIVKVVKPNALGEKTILAVNSCLVYVLCCDGWEITTVEGLGNWSKGYSHVQRRLAAANGTQCGYCTPGWVVSMHCLLESSGGVVSSKQVEDGFAGNLCRCTGYRPILDAFKSFAQDADPLLADRLQDVEDLGTSNCKKNCARRCSHIDESWCILEDTFSELLTIGSKDGTFVKATSIQDVFKMLKKNGLNNYRLVHGNTAKGVFPMLTEPKLLIDISLIAALKESTTDENLVLGAGMTITEVMELFLRQAKKDEDFKYLETLHRHLELVAHVPVRNIGTIGGNLVTKNQHKNFGSDLFLLFEAVRATVSVVDETLTVKESNMQEFLRSNLTGKLITNVKLPPLSQRHFLRTYRVTPRAQSASAIMNACFLFQLDSANKIQDCSIVYGAVSADFYHASETENILKGSQLYTTSTLQKALTKLHNELNPESSLGAGSYTKKMLAIGLFYKAILSLAPADQVDPRFKSGGDVFERPLSRATQFFDTDQTVWPLNKPIPKIEALKQCAGEAIYSDDIAPSPNQVHVALILSTISRGELDYIDIHEAMKFPGVVAVYTAKDIPGTNTFTPNNVIWQTSSEEILVTKKISHYGQVVGIVAAETRKLALRAAKMIPVKYKNVVKDKPVLSIEDALAASDKNDRMRLDYQSDPTSRGTDIKKTIKGTFVTPSQYHFYFETQTACATMTEFGLEMNVATQFVDLVQVSVAGMLGIKESDVNIKVTRLGGGYGGKATRSSQFACVCSLVAYKLNTTARLVLPVQDNMAVAGLRQRMRADFEVSTDDAGVIQSLDCTYYEDCGVSYNDTAAASTGAVMKLNYVSDRWNVRGYSVLTDKATNTWCRAPGTTEGNAIIEHIMERIAYAVNKDSADVKIANLLPTFALYKEMITSFKIKCDYDTRKTEISKFNSENSWRKRSIKSSIMAFPLDYVGNFPVTISVYHGDGSVAITHGGIEMGQGINTKAVQVCAYSLNIPLDKISVKPTNMLVCPNSMVTNGSYTSESVALAIVKACEELTRRLKPVTDSMTNPAWEEIVAAAYQKNINLQVSYTMTAAEASSYTVYGVCVCEAELDALTGQHWVRRLDLLEDAGRSLSPLIDVGQIEGAFIMGLGLWTSEDLVYDLSTGRLLTDRTWTYKPPGAKDIPIDYRIYFRRNNTDNSGILRSKAVGEPALVMAVVVYHCLQDAVAQARKEFGYKDTEWVHLDAPCTVQNIIYALSPNIENMKLKKL